MILVILFFAGLEIWWDWRQIEKNNKKPNYIGSDILRVAVASIVVFVWWLMYGLTTQLIIAPVMIYFTFWFVFDYGLNKARKKKMKYLGWRSLDLWQRNHGGLTFWFYTKAILMVSSIILYYLV